MRHLIKAAFKVNESQRVKNEYSIRITDAIAETDDFTILIYLAMTQLQFKLS